MRKKKKKTSVDREEDDLLDPGNSKKSRVVWSIELHQQFVNAANRLGIEKAVPKRILELMNVPGLSRENVASHLQKFRLYLKRLNGEASQSSDIECTKIYENIRPLVSSSGQLHPQTLAALYGKPIDNHHLSASFGVWLPNDDNLGGSQNQNFSISPVSITTSMAVHGLSSSANIRQKCDVNNKTDHRMRQGYYGSNVNEESWILERSSRKRY